jgi:hypothetical protein
MIWYSEIHSSFLDACSIPSFVQFIVGKRSRCLEICPGSELDELHPKGFLESYLRDAQYRIEHASIRTQDLETYPLVS